MKKTAFCLFLSVLFVFLSLLVHAQIRTENPKTEDSGAAIDSLRKKEEAGLDSIIITAKYIRYTTAGLLKDSTQTIPIDTTLGNYENYNPLYQPRRPTQNLGNLGLDYRDMLFNPRKNIGFDAGFHTLDIYRLSEDSLRYYRARSPYTQLYYVNGGQAEQYFQVIHSQNIKPNWNVGANYNRIGGNGFYQNQKPDHTNIAVFTWYQSPGKRYNLLSNVLFNTLKASENGSITNDSIFTVKQQLSDKKAQTVRLSPAIDQSPRSANRSRQTWRETTLYLKQSYNIGHVDSTGTENSSILPTQRVSHALTYSKNQYKYFRNELDANHAFPQTIPDTVRLTNDSTEVKNLRNEFMYSFYLRGKSLSFIKNELKLDVGLQHDFYWYNQRGYKYNLPLNSTQSGYKLTFQNISLKANLNYHFSDRITIDGDLEQIVQGRNGGDFLYQATSNILLSNAVGRIVLGAYIQNKSPEEVYQHMDYQFHQWDNKFDKSKTTNLSFQYLNAGLKFNAKAEYYLLNNYLYFKETAVDRLIAPTQTANINLLKISVGKDLKFGKFNFNNYAVYQKTDSKAILRIPEIYTYSTFFYSTRFLKIISTMFGFDVRFNTSYIAPSYAVDVSQFYNSKSNAEFSSYPVADVWLKASLRRANVFFKYDYISQGLFSKGYYTVNRYPMPDKLFKFGVRWNFYD